MARNYIKNCFVLYVNDFILKNKDFDQELKEKQVLV